MEDQTQKQQVVELLRKAETLVITTSKKPDADQLAAAVAMTQMLDKLGKRPEAVVSADKPENLSFLPFNILHEEFQGLRDFVIELDTSKTEADKLKYVPEGKRLKVYITPFNGAFSKDDLGFSYGDYHCDGVIMLGADGAEDIDNALASQKQLLEKTKLVSIKASKGSAKGGNIIAWHDEHASSICEMLMSLTEALQPGLMDNHIATSLLTGIVAATEHFTGASTTPKVMTMAAQLMAAGADQGSIIKHLEKPINIPKAPSKHSGDTKTPEAKKAPEKDDSELKPSEEKSLHKKAPKEHKKGKGAIEPQPKPPKPDAPEPHKEQKHTPPPKFAPSVPPPPPPPPPPPGPPPQGPAPGSAVTPHQTPSIDKAFAKPTDSTQASPPEGPKPQPSPDKAQGKPFDSTHGRPPARPGQQPPIPPKPPTTQPTGQPGITPPPPLPPTPPRSPVSPPPPPSASPMPSGTQTPPRPQQPAPSQPPKPPQPPPQTGKLDVDAARKAVEEATKNLPPQT